MGVFEGFLFYLGVKPEKFVLWNSLVEAHWKNLLPLPSDFSYSHIVVSISLGNRYQNDGFPKQRYAVTLCSFIIPLKFLGEVRETLQKL